MKVINQSGFKTLVAEGDIPVRTHIHTLSGSVSFIRSRYSIECEFSSLLFILSSLLLLVSVACVSLVFLGLGVICLFFGFFRPKIHVDDPLFRYCNHSFTPNVMIRGLRIYTIKQISAGEPIVFNYYTTESKIVEKFKDNETKNDVQ